jgi:hypothetical protein
LLQIVYMICERDERNRTREDARARARRLRMQLVVLFGAQSITPATVDWASSSSG